MNVEAYKTGKKVTKTFTIDEGIFEAWKRQTGNMSFELQKFMESQLFNIDLVESEESKIKKIELELKQKKERLSRLQSQRVTEEEAIELVNGDISDKLDKALGVVKRFVRRNGEIGKGQVKKIAQVQGVDYADLLVAFNDFYGDRVGDILKEFEVKNP